MTVTDAMTVFEEQKPGYLSDDEKIRYISLLDSSLLKSPVFYSDERAELIIPEPYSEIYTLFLKAEAELKWNEIEHYNNSFLLFQSLLDEYRRLVMKNSAVMRQDVKYF